MLHFRWLIHMIVGCFRVTVNFCKEQLFFVRNQLIFVRNFMHNDWSIC